MAATLQPAPPTQDMAQTAPNAGLEVAALLTDAAWGPLDEVGWVRVTGSDRVRWLNGMVTNSIQELEPGQGCYNFILNAQGRILGDVTAFLLEDSILLQSSREQILNLISTLDRFIIMDDVELAEIADQRRGLVIAGPRALRVVQELGGAPCSAAAQGLPTPAGLSLKRTEYHGAAVDLIQAYSPLVPRFEIWGDADTITRIARELSFIPKASPLGLEVLRLLEGTPRYGTDMRNSETARDLPQETSQTRALHFAKGCYLGQEIVERIRSRGAVHRTFCAFDLSGVLPAPGTSLTVKGASEGKAVGELTSVAEVSLPGVDAPVQIALGYLRREALAEYQSNHVPFQFSGGTAVPTALPRRIVSLLRR